MQLLNAGESYIGDIASADLAPLVEEGASAASTDAAVLERRRLPSWCASPRRSTRPKTRTCASSSSATDEIAAHQHKGMLIVLESTTYPGTTREVLVPKLTRGLRDRQRRLRRVLARARRSRQHALHHPQHAQGHRRRPRRRASRSRRRSTRSIIDTRRPGDEHRQRRDGEAAREHLPRRQHRASSTRWR